jgi:hypothetical protein
MNHKQTKTVMTSILLVLSLLQGPYIYYYADGLFGFIIVIPYMLTGFALSFFLLVSLKYKQTNTSYHYLGLISGTLIGIASLFNADLIEKLDWELRLSERNRIVELVKQGKLTPNVSHNNIICKLPGYPFPPISVGGNEIAIYKDGLGTVTIEFYINRGFLDNYSAFVFTNERKNISIMDSTISARHSPKFKKLKENWYRVAY